jgi:hypothetical protein
VFALIRQSWWLLQRRSSNVCFDRKQQHQRTKIDHPDGRSLSLSYFHKLRYSKQLLGRSSSAPFFSLKTALTLSPGGGGKVRSKCILQNLLFITEQSSKSPLKRQWTPAPPYHRTLSLFSISDAPLYPTRGCHPTLVHRHLARPTLTRHHQPARRSPAAATRPL